MKKIYILFSLLLCIASLRAQNYYIITSTGTSGDYVYNSNGTNILTTGNEVLSSWQSLPFSWSFYGTAVTGYYASDNGYITFDNAAVTSYASNTSVPNAAGPNNAIYAFWDDFTVDAASGNPDRVRTWTYGTTPNRVHCIQWWSMTPTGSTSWIYATIRIYENGDFDVVHDYSASTAAAATSGTIGCENAGGTLGVQVSGSPSIQFPTYSTAANDDKVYTFVYGTQPQYDLSVTSCDLSGTVQLGNNTVSGVISNLGSATISSFNLNYRVDGGSTVTMTVSGLTLLGSGGTYNYSHSTPWNVATGGQTYSLEVWADNINGSLNDDNNANDTLTESLLSNLGISGNKETVIEEFTGAWCQFCPDGAVVLEQVSATYPTTFHIVSVHDGDAMEFAEGLRTTFSVSSYPSGQIDRVLFSGEAKVPVSRGSWSSFTTQRMNAYTPVNVSVSHTYNTSTRQVNATVTADFVDYAVGDLRFVLAVVEDSVIGSGTGYNQVNYYNTQSGHPYYQAGNPIIGYPHRHTLRAWGSNAMGNSGVIPGTVSPSGNYSENFQITLPASWDEQKISLIGYVYSYDADVLKGEVLNSGGQDLGAPIAIDPSLDSNDGIIANVPNPVRDMGYVAFNFSSTTDAEVSIYNIYGQKISTIASGTYGAGEHQVWYNVENVANGVYQVVVKTPGATYSDKIVVAK